MLFSLGLNFDRFNRQIDFFMNTVMFFYRREALQASQLSFLLPNHHTNLRELTFFILHHLITYAGLFQLDRHVVVFRKLQQ